MDRSKQAYLASLRKAATDFYTFCQIVTKDDGLEPFAKFQKLICDRIQNQLNTSKFGLREMFSVPPGYGKSTLLSQLLPAFLLGFDPSYKIMLISYASSLSNRNAIKVREIMMKPIYQAIFPETKFSGKAVKPPYDTSKGGGIRSMGRGGSITGFRADFILIDDILKGPDEAASDTLISQLHDWYATVVNTRIKPKGGIIILSTRWTKRDLIGYLSEKSKRWNYINLEAICTDTKKDPLNRKKGEPLWGSYKSLESLREIQSLNPLSFEIVFQGHCIEELSKKFDPAKVQYTPTDPFDVHYTVISVDSAAKPHFGADKSVFTVWNLDKTLTKAVLVDFISGRFKFDELVNKFDELELLYTPSAWFIENASSGIQLLQVRELPHVFRSKTFKNYKGIANEKLQIMDLFTKAIGSKNITVNASVRKRFITDFLPEILDFPHGNDDDHVLSALHFTRFFYEPARTVKVQGRGKNKTTDITKKLAHFQKNSKRIKRNSKYLVKHGRSKRRHSLF